MEAFIRPFNLRSWRLKSRSAVLLFLSLCLAAQAQIQDTFYNGGTLVNYTPQINATNFVNDYGGTFSFSQTPPSQNLTLGLYDGWHYTANFYNAGEMDCPTGFYFDTQTGAGHKLAAGFYNYGNINCGTNGGGLNNPAIYVNASNILNSGTITVGLNGLTHFGGNNVNLYNGQLTMQTFSLGNNADIYATGQTGTDTNGDWVPGFPDYMLNANSAVSSAPLYFFLNQATPYFDIRWDNTGTNLVIRVVYLQNNSSNTVAANVYFAADPANGFAHVEWLGPYISPATGQVATNYLYLDNDYVQGSSSNILNYTSPGVPRNFTFTESATPIFYGTPTNSNYAWATAQLWGDTPFSPYAVSNNIYSYVNAQVISTTVSTNSVANGALTNMVGRMEITASNELNLALATMTGMNYLQLRSTNQFDYDGQSIIASPFSDIYLGCTNGSFAVTNLILSAIPLWTGNVQAWSTRWIFSDPNMTPGFSLDYRVVLVSDQLNPVTAPQEQDLVLYGSNNIVISDVLNVFRNLYLTCTNLLLTTNGIGVGANSPDGELNLNSAGMTWAGSLPRLRVLTNNGAIRITDYNPTQFGSASVPYLAMVNTGTISNTAGAAITANNFENDGGWFSSGTGSFTVQSLTSTMTNGYITTGGAFTDTSSSLVIGGNTILAGNAITLTATNLLTDNGLTNSFWSLGSGFHGFGIAPGLKLSIKPAVGDLLGTTITNYATVGTIVTNIWAGQDRGYSTAGFANNAALGQLVLKAQGTPLHTTFYFTGAGTNNAIYVDCLQLADYASYTNRVGTNLTVLGFNTNLVIYYAQALAGGVSVAEKINHFNGDHLRWVPSYAGTFSSVALVYPNGSTNIVNAALAASPDIDSDGDGIANSIDPTPFLVPSQLNFILTVTNNSSRLQWTTIPNSTNFVYYKTNLLSPTWLPLTNFTKYYYGANLSVTNASHVNWFASPQPYPSAATNVWLFDALTNVPHYYRVAVQPWLTYPN